MLLCSYHRRLLHEGGYRIRRDYQGEHYFVRADGRTIPRCGYRADDFADRIVDEIADVANEQAPENFMEEPIENPSVEGHAHPNGDCENPSMEVREPRGIYRVRPSWRAAVA